MTTVNGTLHQSAPIACFNEIIIGNERDISIPIVENRSVQCELSFQCSY